MHIRALLVAACLASVACAEPNVEESFQPVPIGDSPVRGPADAWVTIVEFADFECPYCVRAAETIAEIEAAYGADVRLVFKHYPLDFHQRAMPAAVAAECARAQGRFWAMYDRLFDAEGALSASDLERYAGAVGLDLATWRGCVSSGAHQSRIDSDVQLAESLGVSATPTLFINGWRVVGAQPFAELKRVVDRELEKAKASGIPRESYYERAVAGSNGE
ncbi:MAG: DsbA family protein [Myxococcales bacterium]|jgi:protein-disulfide isomerase